MKRKGVNYERTGTKKKRKYSKFSKEDDEILLEQAKKNKKIPWTKLARETFHNKYTSVQLFQRYHRVLKPDRSQWNPKEDRDLLRLHQEIGPRWSEISRRLGSNRCDVWVRQRYYTLMDRKLRKSRGKGSQSSVLGKRRGRSTVSNIGSNPYQPPKKRQKMTRRKKKSHGRNKKKISRKSELAGIQSIFGRRTDGNVQMNKYYALSPYAQALPTPYQYGYGGYQYSIQPPRTNSGMSTGVNPYAYLSQYAAMVPGTTYMPYQYTSGLKIPKKESEGVTSFEEFLRRKREEEAKKFVGK